MVFHPVSVSPLPSSPLTCNSQSETTSICQGTNGPVMVGMIASDPTSNLDSASCSSDTSPLLPEDEGKVAKFNT